MLSQESYNSCQLRSEDLLALRVLSSNRICAGCSYQVASVHRKQGSGGIFWWFSERELKFIQNCTRYIMDPAITINILLLSVNIPCLQPFSSLTTWFSTYKNPNPWSYNSETPFLTSKLLQTRCQLVHFPVISDVLSEFLSKLFATDGVGFSSKIPFRRYQIWSKSIMWKGRYKRNKMQPYHDPAFSVSLYQFWME